MRRIWMVALALGMLLLASLGATAQVGSQPFVGEILLVPYNFAPNGFAQCNGQLLAISQNTALFSLLGTYYGGDGRSTFALPDLRGRTPIGEGQGPGLSLHDLGETGGEEVVTLLVSQIPAHTHVAYGSGNVANLAGPSAALWGTQSTLKIYAAAPDSAMAPGAVSPSGSNLPHHNLSPYLTLNYVIALQGIFPARN